MSRFFIRKETSRGMSAALGSASRLLYSKNRRNGTSRTAPQLEGAPHKALSMDGDHDEPFVLLQPAGSKDMEPSVVPESRSSRVRWRLAVEQASKKEGATKSCSVGET